MSILASLVNPQSKAFKDNEAYHRNLLAELHKRLDTVKEEPNNFIDDCGNRRAANNSVHKKKMEKAKKSKDENEQDDGKFVNKSINDSSKE